MIIDRSWKSIRKFLEGLDFMPQHPAELDPVVKSLYEGLSHQRLLRFLPSSTNPNASITPEQKLDALRSYLTFIGNLEKIISVYHLCEVLLRNRTHFVIGKILGVQDWMTTAIGNPASQSQASKNSDAFMQQKFRGLSQRKRPSNPTQNRVIVPEDIFRTGLSKAWKLSDEVSKRRKTPITEGDLISHCTLLFWQMFYSPFYKNDLHNIGFLDEVFVGITPDPYPQSGPKHAAQSAKRQSDIAAGLPNVWWFLGGTRDQHSCTA